MNPFSLKNKTILITGASSGIGAACAKECSRQGAHVIMTGRNMDRLKNVFEFLSGTEHTIIPCDLTEEEDLKSLISKLTPLDGIILSAGVNLTLPLSFLSKKKIDSVFNINLFSQIELLRLILKKKLIRENGSVVALSSIGGNSVFSKGSAAYGASKAALLSWMKTAAKELAPKIRVNCILPGQVNTPMNQQGDITEEQYDSYRKSIPMGRFGEPEEIAYSAIFLLSDAAKWITGSALTVDGGTTLN